MNDSSPLPLSRSADQILNELRAEVLRLEHERDHFDELPPERRLKSVDVYAERIRRRQALLDLLGTSSRPQ
ncbi:MAG: hypothetical protein K0R03_395 [Moraxellaceae bacterium]|jgi:hypothetical protein|nr:hypothetical protein [Moraxellaceae bacterium]MDF3029837.1 hypothetical protein [Moraxellaceae bacterium]